VDTFEPLHPKKVKAKSSDNLIHTRSFTGLFRTLRVSGGVSVPAVLRHRVAELGRSPGGAVGPGESKFHIFGATFWPQDFILLSALLIICAFGLFAITVFAGRVWCGYTCPQSSWTWLFMWCESHRGRTQPAHQAASRALEPEQTGAALGQAHLVAGHQRADRADLCRLLHPDPPAGRRTADLATGRRQPVLGAVLHRRHLHQCRLAARSGVHAHVPLCAVPERDVRQGHPDHFLRRRPWRNRGPRKREVTPEVGLGDCIDCQLCVQVCPTGIDIRDGLQMECIGCAACIDACDSIMDKMGYARGLISYTSEHQLQGGKTHLLRPRLIGYSAVLLVMIGALVVALVNGRWCRWT
jgi:ferredoxin